jgi:hypothetical protein
MWGADDPVRGRQSLSDTVGPPVDEGQVATGVIASDEYAVAGVAGDFIGGRAGAPSSEKVFPEPGQALLNIVRHHASSPLEARSLPPAVATRTSSGLSLPAVIAPTQGLQYATFVARWD